MKITRSSVLGLVASLALSANTLLGGPVVTGFDSSSLPGNDDGSTSWVNFGLGPLNFFGTTYSGAWLNNNGNMTFAAPEFTYTPSAITGLTSNPMIASFFADVDTRAGALMQYGNGTFEGHAAFGQTWRDVGYYYIHTDKLNTFQTLLVDRSDIAVGDFDIYFNYDKIQWETGDASYGSGGLGGVSAYAGFTNGAGTYFQLAGSGINGAFLDGGVNALAEHSMNTAVTGRYLFTVRSGIVHSTPDGASVFALLGLALTALAVAKRKLS